MAAEEPGQDPIGDDFPASNHGEGDVRLSSLDARLKAAANADKARTGTVQRKPEKGYSQGSRVLAELIAGPAGGALLGWLLDRWFGTSPWALLALMTLGIAAAFRSIFRISSERPE